MAKPGNPNHDPSTGRFTSGGGLNRSNSTRGQRAKENIKTVAKTAATVAGGIAVGAAVHLGRAALVGAARSIRNEANIRTSDMIHSAAPHIQRAAEKHTTAAIQAAGRGATAAAAGISSAGKSISSHANSIKHHIQSLHKKDPVSFGKKGLLSRKTNFPKGYSPLS